LPLRLELSDSRLDLGLLTLEMLDLIVDLLRRELQLGARAFAPLLEGADLGEGESEALALQNQARRSRSRAS
jgi:hypothetical protein